MGRPPSLGDGGDFNLICNLEEKKGGLRRLFKINETFSENIVEWEHIDMKKTNQIYT